MDPYLAEYIDWYGLPAAVVDDVLSEYEAQRLERRSLRRRDSMFQALIEGFAILPNLRKITICDYPKD